MAFAFRPGRSDELPGRDLLGDLIDLLNAQYPDRVAWPGSVTTPDEIVAPDGVFLIGYEDGDPIARVRLDAGPEQRHSRVPFTATGYVEIGPYNATTSPTTSPRRCCSASRCDVHTAPASHSNSAATGATGGPASASAARRGWRRRS